MGRWDVSDGPKRRSRGGLVAVTASVLASLASGALLLALLRFDTAPDVLGNQDSDYERLVVITIAYALVQPALLAIALIGALQSEPGQARHRALLVVSVGVVAAVVLAVVYPVLNTTAPVR